MGESESTWLRRFAIPPWPGAFIRAIPMTCAPRCNLICLPAGKRFPPWAASCPTPAISIRDMWRAQSMPGSICRRRCILMCPNHTGMGHPLAIMSVGAWDNAAGPCAHRRRAGRRFETTLSAARGRCRGASRRTWRRSAIAISAGQKTGLHICPHRSGHGRYEVLQALGIVIAEAVQARANRCC